MNVLTLIDIFFCIPDDADVSDQSLKVEVANLKERVHELEEELAMEKNRGVLTACMEKS